MDIEKKLELIERNLEEKDLEIFELEKTVGKLRDDIDRLLKLLYIFRVPKYYITAFRKEIIDFAWDNNFGKEDLFHIKYLLNDYPGKTLEEIRKEDNEIWEMAKQRNIISRMNLEEDYIQEKERICKILEEQKKK